jgi:hypothetical protein
MLYREDDVPDWMHEARTIIRLDGEDDIAQESQDEEEIVMHKIMARYDEEDVDNLAYDDEDDDIEDEDLEDDFDEDDDIDWEIDDEDLEDDDFEDFDEDELDEDDEDDD